MPLNILFFNSLLLATCGYAAWRGGMPERYVAVSLFVAAMATLVTISPYSTRFVGVEYGVLVVDAGLLVVLVAIALHANRYWPLALSSLHLASLVAHFGKLLDYRMGGWGYAFLLKLWAYPMLLTLVIGTIRHRRRVSQFGVDRSWSTFNG